MIAAADLAEKNRPQLKQFDSYGRRIDIIDYHPSYHTLMTLGLTNGSASYGYNRSSSVGSHLTRAALIYMENQLEPGHCCPIVMTSAAIPVLRKSNYCRNWLQKVVAEGYDSENKPIEEKLAATIVSYSGIFEFQFKYLGMILNNQS